MGEFVKGPSSSVEPPVVRKLRAKLAADGVPMGNGSTTPPPQRPVAQAGQRPTPGGMRPSAPAPAPRADVGSTPAAAPQRPAAPEAQRPAAATPSSERP